MWKSTLGYSSLYIWYWNWYKLLQGCYYYLRSYQPGGVFINIDTIVDIN
jgi:hypothetical protein